MGINEIIVSVALSTTVVLEKVERIADECGIKLSLLEIRMRKDRQWVNDFEVEGSAGKVDGFLIRIKDVEVR